jgi:arsenate reductase
MEIWFNPSCSKCRVTKDLLDEAGAEYDVRRYLDTPPTRADLERVLELLGIEPWELARLDEPVAKEIGLRDLPHERGPWLDAMVEHPILIQRPIVVTDDGRAVIGRPPERVIELLRDGG